jgi:hypothetical protein
MTLGYNDSVFLSMMADSGYIPSRERLHDLGRLVNEELTTMISALKMTQQTDTKALP